MAAETNSIVSFNNAHNFISIKLTGPTNYLFWKRQITLFLEGHNLMGYVDGTHQCPPKTHPDHVQWVQQDTLIMSLLIASLSEDLFPKVIGLETSHDIWTTLEKALAFPSNTHQSVHENDQSVTQMDPNLYISAKDGEKDVLRQNKDELHLQLTGSRNTLLHVLAQFHDSAECVDAILEMENSTIKQSMLKWKNTKGETALHIAANHGRSKIVQALIEQAKSFDRESLESGVKIAEELMRATDQNGDTALLEAVRNKHAEVAKFLVEQDPDFLYPSNNMEETPLYLAVEGDSHDMVASILTTCKSLAYKGPGGKTALHAAVIKKCEDCIAKLLEHKQDLTKEVDEFGWGPLHYAAHCKKLSIATRLLEADRSAAYITAKKDDNKTPFHVAAWFNNVEVMKELLKHCPDCRDMTTSKGQNVLHLAVDYESQEVLDFILSNHWAANLINEKDAEGNTPLHLYATSYKKLNGQHLVELGADTNAFNRQNLTPLDMIVNVKHHIYNKDSKKKELEGKGGQLGCQNIVPRRLSKTRKWKGAINKDVHKLPFDIRKAGETRLIVATLIATVTFAAGFTLPGGYDGNEGPNQGMPILARKAAFKAFILSNTIAVFSSIIAVLYYFAAAESRHKLKVHYYHVSATFLVIIAAIATTVAFITGLYTVLAPSYLKAAISVCFFGSSCILISFLVLYPIVKKGLRLYGFQREMTRKS